jgi:BirA family biotin operon repressor/biotin-[acetyl-CoA-carboxylase] ligase
MIKKIIHFKQVSSTQETAKRFIHKNEEIAISSLQQKRGRGRQGRSWFSPPGGLYLSLLLFPKTKINSIPFLAGLTIVRVLEDYNFSKLSILWPNDILLNNRKVSGIICEQYKNAIICGIGLNVNIEDFAPRFKKATSLKIESGREYNIDRMLNKIIGTFNPLYNGLQKEGLKIKEVLNYLTGLGEPVEIITSREIIKGIVYDIDDDWALILRDNSGMLRKFYYGDVRRLSW